MIKLTYFQI